MAPKVAGSSPVYHPFFFFNAKFLCTLLTLSAATAGKLLNSSMNLVALATPGFGLDCAFGIGSARTDVLCIEALPNKSTPSVWYVLNV